VLFVFRFLISLFKIKKEKYTDDDSERENARQSEEIIRKNAKINELEQRVKSYEVELENQKEEVKPFSLI